MSKLFSESTSVPEKTSTPGRWRAVFLTEGKGSSGNWLRETIERDGPAALPKGSRCFVTHNRLENGEPDPFRMWGTLAEDARYEDGKLVGEIDILPSWRERVEEVAPHTALSVYLMGESDADNNITSIIQDVQNGVDLVVHPGREGSTLVEKLYESAIAGSDVEPTVTLAEENGVKMDQEMKDAFAAINARFDTLSAEKTAAEATAAKVEADAEAVAKAVEAYASAERAVEAADLFKSQKESILAEAKKGVDVAPLIEAAKAVAVEAKAEAEAHVSESASVGRVITESVETSYGAFA